jgi:hypothetical protein
LLLSISSHRKYFIYHRSSNWLFAYTNLCVNFIWVYIIIPSIEIQSADKYIQSDHNPHHSNLVWDFRCWIFRFFSTTLEIGDTFQKWNGSQTRSYVQVQKKIKMKLQVLQPPGTHRFRRLVDQMVFFKGKNTFKLIFRSNKI